MKKLKENISSLFYILIVAALLNIGLSTLIQMFVCPKLTQTELMILIPNSFVYNIKECNG